MHFCRDVVIVVVGAVSAEGSDRKGLGYPPEQNAMVAAVAAVAGKMTVVVGINPGAVLLPWAKDVAAVLLMFVPGLEMGMVLELFCLSHRLAFAHGCTWLHMVAIKYVRPITSNSYKLPLFVPLR
jgi:hypothetical protein